mgnify:CR=1 FL=1
MIHVTMGEEKEFGESVDVIQSSIGKVITTDSWEIGKSSGETAHLQVFNSLAETPRGQENCLSSIIIG